MREMREVGELRDEGDEEGRRAREKKKLTGELRAREKKK